MNLGSLADLAPALDSAQKQIIHAPLCVQCVAETFGDRLNDDDLSVVQSRFIQYIKEFVDKAAKKSALAKLYHGFAAA